jgi:hypothetical protein
MPMDKYKLQLLRERDEVWAEARESMPLFEKLFSRCTSDEEDGKIVLVQRESDKPVSQLRDFSCLRQIQNPPLAGLFLSGFLRHHKAPNYQKNS